MMVVATTYVVGLNCCHDDDFFSATLTSYAKKGKMTTHQRNNETAPNFLPAISLSL